jgi:nucleoside-triphosphatase THEP1
VQSEGLIYVVTGERGSGKTTVCERVVREARRRGLAVAGILTERIATERGEARRVTDLSTGESRSFGSQYLPRGPGEARGACDPLTPGWSYDAGVFAWGNEALSHTTQCDLLVIDEVGPLELRGARGWVKALEVLRTGDFHTALVVCRPGLLKELENCLGGALKGAAEVTQSTRETLPAVIMEALLGLA